MAALTQQEVVAGAVVQLDADGIRAAGGAKTNAEKTAGHDRCVVGEHSFLVLKVDPTTGSAWLAPIFSATAPGSELLREQLKSGYSDKWLGVDLYFNKWQHWEIPIKQIVQYSGVEDTPPGSRRAYAANDVAELDRILQFSRKNRAPWRQLP